MSGEKFKTIVADPPWRTTTGPQFRFKDGGHRPLAYPTMKLEEIKSIPVGAHAEPAAHLYLWTTNILVRAAYEVVEAWGFKPSVLLTWAKNPIGIGLGDAFGITTEHVLFAHRGGLRPACRIPTTWWNWKRGRHSAKPEEFQDVVERVSPGPYLELFARRKRQGWAVWGNEIECDIDLLQTEKGQESDYSAFDSHGVSRQPLAPSDSFAKRARGILGIPAPAHHSNTPPLRPSGPLSPSRAPGTGELPGSLTP